MPRFTTIGGGDMIYEELESTGTSTAPDNTQHLVTREIGLVSMAIKLTGSPPEESEYSRGAAKCIADNTAAGSGREGGVAQRCTAGEAVAEGFVGCLTYPLGITAEDDFETGELQCYGYFKDARSTAAAENALLAPDVGVTTDVLDDISTEGRMCAIALEAGAANVGDVFIFGM